MVHVFCRREARARHWNAFIQIAEPNAGRLIHEDDVCVLAPSMFIVYSTITILVDQTWAKLLQQSNHGGTSGAASHP
jgi:hypothetical protein